MFGMLVLLTNRLKWQHKLSNHPLSVGGKALILQRRLKENKNLRSLESVRAFVSNVAKARNSVDKELLLKSDAFQT